MSSWGKNQGKVSKRCRERTKVNLKVREIMKRIGNLRKRNFGSLWQDLREKEIKENWGRKTSKRAQRNKTATIIFKCIKSYGWRKSMEGFRKWCWMSSMSEVEWCIDGSILNQLCQSSWSYHPCWKQQKGNSR